MTAPLSKSRVVAMTIWLVVSLFYAYQYILRVMPNIMLNDIMERFDIGATAFGQFSGIYYIGYSLMHLPIGIMLDRFGPRRVVSGCILLTIIGMLPLLFAQHWLYPIAGRFLIGLGSSAAILGVFKIIRMAFSETQFPRMLSLSVTIGLIGAIYGGGPVSYMRDLLGYDTVLQILALSGVALAVATYWVLPDVTTKAQGTVFANIREVLGNRRVIWSCLFAGLMVGPLEGFADVWGSAFLKQVYGYDGTLAATMPSIIFIGMCFGAPVLSFIAEKVGSYLVTIIGAGSLMMIGFSALLLWPLPSTILMLNFGMIGVCCAYQILAIYKASTYVREEVAGLTTAMANMIIMIFGYAFHAIIGSVVNATGGATLSQALVSGVAVIPIAIFIGTGGFMLLLQRERSVMNVPFS